MAPEFELFHIFKNGRALIRSLGLDPHREGCVARDRVSMLQ